MPFCPNCKAEYLAGVSRCSDCGLTLVDQLPEPVQHNFAECENCDGEVTEESEFCVHCGVMLGEGEFKCEEHPAKTAVGVCIICRRLVCSECAVRKQNRLFCDEHKSVEVSEDWAVAFQSVEYYEANIVRGKLENAGVTVNPRNNLSIGFIADGFIESALGRSILKYPVKVFVPLDQYLSARDIIMEESPLEE